MGTNARTNISSIFRDKLSLQRSSYFFSSFCFVNCLKQKHEAIFCIGTEILIRLFWINEFIWFDAFFCCQKSAVIGHQISVSLVSPGLCLFLFPPCHTSILLPLHHLQAVGICQIFFSTTSQLNLFDLFEACFVTNNLTLPPIGAINSLHRLQREHLLYLCWHLTRIQEPLADCPYGTVDHLAHCLCSRFRLTWWLPQHA